MRGSDWAVIDNDPMLLGAAHQRVRVELRSVVKVDSGGQASRPGRLNALLSQPMCLVADHVGHAERHRKRRRSFQCQVITGDNAAEDINGKRQPWPPDRLAVSVVNYDDVHTGVVNLNHAQQLFGWLEVLLRRKAARDRHGPAKKHFEPSKELLGMVEIDHTRVDVIVVDDAYREPIGRPWLTLAIDVFSRVVAGYYLTLEAPSSLSVALCMAHMVSDKAHWLAEQSIQATWPGGLPAAVHLDNAAEFHADALVRGSEEHGIVVNYRPVATPHYGGHIERLVGTIMGEVHLLPGTTFSNIAERGNYDSERHAVMTVAELDLWLTRQIAVLYHGAPHKGLGGRTPLGVWEEAVANGRGPRTAPDPGRVRLDFLPFELRQPRRDGIELFRLGYWHDALPALAARGKAKLRVRYDPRDMSRAWLRPAGEPDYLELRLKDLRRPAVTLWEWRAAGKHLRAQGRCEFNEEAQFQAVEANRLLVADAKTKTSRRLAQRRAAARKGTASAAVGAPASNGTAPGPDYSKPPKLYDVEEWS